VNPLSGGSVCTLFSHSCPSAVMHRCSFWSGELYQNTPHMKPMITIATMVMASGLRFMTADSRAAASAPESGGQSAAAGEDLEAERVGCQAILRVC
jgi:hypothetical protein